MAPAIHKTGPLSLRRSGQEIRENEAYARNFYQQQNGPRHAQNFFIFFVPRHTSVRIFCVCFWRDSPPPIGPGPPLSRGF